MHIERISKHKSCNEGFTIVEVLLSIVLFGILMTAFLTIFTSAVLVTIKAGDRDKTLAGASGRVENKLAAADYAVPGEPDAVKSEPTTVTIIYGDAAASHNTVGVNKTTGKSAMKDGTQITIEYFKTVTP
jgi:prepilin-type N-terminal cleavage/methylation domain-containing protein